MTTRQDLVKRIDAYLALTGKSATAFCKDAGVDHHIIPRLKRGDSVTLRSIEKLEAEMDICQLDAEAVS